MTTFIFDKKEKEYLNWLQENKDSYVLNVARLSANKYQKLHTSSCHHIRNRRDNMSNDPFTGQEWIKICSESINEIVQWMDSNGYPSIPDVCGLCKPDISNKTNIDVLNIDIEKAFIDFDNGIRPDGYVKPKHWYVLNSNNRAYPAKGIWALATNARKLSDFNTSKARAEFAKYGYALLDTSKIAKSNELEIEVKKSTIDGSKKRIQRLRHAPKKPDVEYSLTKTYKRNPDVIAEVLSRSNGICESCNDPAPFSRKSDGSPFLEVHHKIQLSKGGDDSIENAIAVCPNCHREHHYG